MTNVHISTKYYWWGEMQCFFSIYSEKLDILLIINYCESSNKPPESLFLSIRFYGGFNREGWGGGYVVKQGTTLLFQTKRRWYHYLHKERTVGKKKRSCSWRTQIWTSSTWIKHTGSVYMKCYSCDELIQFIIYSFGCEE